MHGVVFAAGLLITLVTLADIFATILVPGPNDGFLRVGARIGRATLPAARFLARDSRGPGRRPSNRFAPLILLLAFAAWMLLLLAGFGLLFLAIGGRFAPALRGPQDALFVAGQALLTLGLSDVTAHGVARWLVLAAALSGFAVISATITFILQVQSALHKRESLVLTLGSIAGTPPSGVALLQAVAKLHVERELHAFFREWRDWAAAVLHSHLSSPVLVFFHSVDQEGDWLAALEAVLDAATLLMTLCEDDAVGAATLMHRVGSRTVARLCQELRLHETAATALTQAEVEHLATRLGESGYVTVAPDADKLAKLRADYAGRIAALATLLGADRTKPLADS